MIAGYLLPLAYKSAKGSTESTALRCFISRALQLLPFDTKYCVRVDLYKRKKPMANCQWLKANSKQRISECLSFVLFNIDSRHLVDTVDGFNRAECNFELVGGVNREVYGADSDMVCRLGSKSVHRELQLLGDTIYKIR